MKEDSVSEAVKEELRQKSDSFARSEGLLINATFKKARYTVSSKLGLKVNWQ